MPEAMRSFGRIALAAYAGLFALAWFFSDVVIFQPRPPSYSDGPPYRKIPTPGGGFVAIRSLRNPDARFTILFSHGKRRTRRYRTVAVPFAANDFRCAYDKRDTARATEALGEGP
jgi:hypothetical protein